MRKTRGEALAKFILMGEHFIVHGGVPALAFPIKALSTVVEVEESATGAISCQLWQGSQLEKSEILQRTMAQAVALAAKHLGVALPHAGLSVKSRTNFPISRGFGSSAAFSVALVDALAEFGGLFKISCEKKSEVVMELEKLFHGKPSGVDAAAILAKAPVRFEEGRVVRTLQNRAVDFVVVDGGERLGCKELVQHVALRRTQDPQKWSELSETVKACVTQCEQALERGDAMRVAEAVNRCHGILQNLQLSTPAIEALLVKARELGALGGKVSGAGAGGAVVLITKPGEGAALMAKLRDQGYEVLAVEQACSLWQVEPLKADAKIGRVFSPTNIALAKYWGKRNVKLNLPTNGSISATLRDFGSFTTVEFHEDFKTDRLLLNGKEQGREALQKVEQVLNDLRKLAGVELKARVQSMNNFPTAAGLASSASGLSAVTLAGARALRVDQDLTKLSEISRKGSGSSCRSLFGGFVEWKRGERDDGTDSVAVPLAPESHWPLTALIALVNQSQKTHASTGGMEHTRQTSPYFAAWVEGAQASLAPIREAILKKDFHTLAELAEANCLRFHCSAMAAEPPILYWQGRTLDLIHTVRHMRLTQGLKVFFTVDAGPNVVVFVAPEDVEKALAGLKQIPDVKILQTVVGPGARDFNESEWRDFHGEF